MPDDIIVNESNPILIDTKWFVKYAKSDFNMLKSKGNEMYKSGHYHQALRYSNGLYMDVKTDDVRCSF
jgi:hypothetical protein